MYPTNKSTSNQVANVVNAHGLLSQLAYSASSLESTFVYLIMPRVHMCSEVYGFCVCVSVCV